MIIRSEQPADVRSIFRVNAKAFPTPLEARLVDALRDVGVLTISLIAEEDDEIVGHVAFSPVTVPGATGGMGLAPVAVVPAMQRRGIADRLIREGLAICERSDVGFVVVLGEPAYYGRFGFQAAAQWKLSDEYGGGEAFQAMELRPGAIPTAGGLVRYAPPFAEVEEEETD